MKPLSKTKHRAKRVCVIILAVLLSYVVFSVAGSVVVFNIIFSRTSTVHAFELQYGDIDQSKYPRNEFYFDSEGESLFGCVYSPRGICRGIVLVANGMNSCIDRHLPEIMYFVDGGWSVMAFENTGVGKSSGGSTVGISQARIDTVSAIKYIKSTEKLKNLPLALYGHSLGGYAVTAALDDESGVCAVVSLSAFNSPNENMLYSARQRVGIFADLQYPFMCMQNFFRFGNKADDSALEAINSTDVPVMIINGENDNIVPYEISLAEKKPLITNPNTVAVTVDEPYRDGHSTLWLSSESARYLAETENPTDKEKANQLDSEFMSRILSFLNKAAGEK